MTAPDDAEVEREKSNERALAETQTAGFGLANGKVVDRLLIAFDRETPVARIRYERVHHPDPISGREKRREDRGAMVVDPRDTHHDSQKLEIGTSYGRDRVIAEWNEHAPRAYIRHERKENGQWTGQASWELPPAKGIAQVGGDLVTDGGQDVRDARDDEQDAGVAHPDPIGPNDEYEWCEDCEDHHAWECYYCGRSTGRTGECCHCGRPA